ncbi:hypothetical protein SEA_GALACTICA_112 [Streptomyces phage Galactica]|nr:hypothetical protein SEA_GALACTICA_112 [Streptomyces phage Galactica]
MAATKTSYQVTTPEGQTLKFEKGGKVPAFAILIQTEAGWELSGSYSYKTDKLAAHNAAKATWNRMDYAAWTVAEVAPAEAAETKSYRVVARTAGGTRDLTVKAADRTAAKREIAKALKAEGLPLDKVRLTWF